MSAISTFSDSVNNAFDTLGNSVEGITADITDLKKQIEALQNSAGQISAEDQALLDGIQARATAIADKVKALDALTEQPPVPPAA